MYDESMVPRGTVAATSGPSTVFDTTGWGIGSVGAGPSAGGGGGAEERDGGHAAADARDDESPVDAEGDASSEAADGEIDEDASTGRPVGIAIAGTVASALASPSASGGAYARNCPRDAVVIGYMGTVNAPDASVDWLRSFQPICGSLTVTGVPPYVVETSSSATLAQVGDTRGDIDQTVVCPPDQVVVGFGAHSGSFIDSIAFTCAPLDIASGDAGYELSVGETTALAAIGGPRGMTFTQVQCPPGAVAVGNAGKAGRDINSVGLLCGTPSLVFE
jgi:hypothetical protein